MMNSVAISFLIISNTSLLDIPTDMVSLLVVSISIYCTYFI